MTHPQLKEEREGHQHADVFSLLKTRKLQHELVGIINRLETLWRTGSCCFLWIVWVVSAELIVCLFQLHLQKIQVPARKSEAEYSQTESKPAEPPITATGWVIRCTCCWCTSVSPAVGCLPVCLSELVEEQWSLYNLSKHTSDNSLAELCVVYWRFTGVGEVSDHVCDSEEVFLQLSGRMRRGPGFRGPTPEAWNYH